jgi:hypothetical protein
MEVKEGTRRKVKGGMKLKEVGRVGEVEGWDSVEGFG